MQLIIKKSLIIISFIITFELNQSNVFGSNNNGFEDFGLISIMYHRFNENKYPTTNIQMDVFKEQLRIIESAGIKFVHPKDFENSLSQDKGKKDFIHSR